MSTFFRIGTIRIKDASGVVQARNAADSAYADVAVKQLRVQNTNASDAVLLSSPSGLSGSITLTLPGTLGSAGQFVALTDGAGTLGFADSVSNADLTQYENFTQATSSPLAIFTPPDDAIIRQVIIVVTSAAGAGNPTVSVGNTGDNDEYMLTTQSDLKDSASGPYAVNPMIDVGTAPDPINLYITPDGQTFTGTVYVVYTNPS